MIRLPLRTTALIAGFAMTLACQAQPSAPAPAPQSATASAQPPIVGAWRKVSDAQFNQQYRYSMLPGVAAAGSRWAVYDHGAGKTVCCLVVVGPEISEAELDGTYGIPGPWITDLVNGWNLDAAPYRPRVQLLRAEGALLDYEFADMADELGGLLLPAQAKAVAPRTLELDGQRYAVERKEVPLASDDGTVHAYALRPARGGTPLAVEVPYGIY
ncbi:Uncharacterised protein [Achromobacter denitrificans]|uniref:hypothetical protein n=1 Tax=Achromobacter denitrificans TaxID=32002 RepID=UPI0007869262|nr:hypothetical protein [Achromobacter denitrificans]OLU05137.1 hypothetical protein BVK87_22435 [Achromobacter denitrificans]QKH43258.1 hypothetical protein FOC82_18080 [Achromobacter denitrificans]QKH49600.1 hypothetical protein FOC80_09070 [Achromobacter denitrificans]CAB3711862.1 hypothetical protein LMG1231_03204 [Achromobacter denitrificans]SUU14833.1 Uncharacterised protein [Achromobacter denitrificans]